MKQMSVLGYIIFMLVTLAQHFLLSTVLICKNFTTIWILCYKTRLSSLHHCYCTMFRQDTFQKVLNTNDSE
uniref:Putative secreted protein n=1 Tax=Rhipicephalus microplus TaxID=6941 RepID=A0A6G5A0Z7_RHIMP